MRISVIGTGHVGLVTAACFAHVGHEILGIDADPAKIDTILGGESPFEETGLTDLLREGLENGRLRFGTDPAEAASFGPLAFVCVGTPSKESGEADLSYIEGVGRAFGGALGGGYAVLAERSTVPVGTGEWLKAIVQEEAPAGAEFDVVANPEFLQEGYAVRDTLEPTRIVVGTDSERAAALMREAYEPIIERSGSPYVPTDMATAEVVKHASNAYLATRISFINQVADICEASGADVGVVSHAMGLDPRIGPSFLRAGLGYGGACLPKDVQAFRFRGEELGVDMPMLDAVDIVNRTRRTRFVDRIREAAGGTLDGKRIGIWGLAFKPDTDDLRAAPALEIATLLDKAGAAVTAYDPMVMPEAKELLPFASFAADAYGSAAGADVLAICTEWTEFVVLDMERVHGSMNSPVIVDGRNMFDPTEMAVRGFTYLSVGRPTA